MLQLIWNFNIHIKKKRSINNNNNINNIINNINNNNFISVSSLLAGQRPTNLGHHLYHSEMDRDLSYDKHTQ